jgi:multiple sugar transport system permease protein
MVTLSLPLSTWLMTTFAREVPLELEEVALIDGATRRQILQHVVFPLARPGIISVFLVNFLTTWNAFLIPLIISNTAQSQTITVVLTLFIGQYEVAWEAMAAATVLVMIPPIALALLFQRYLVRGLSFGAVKG